MGRHRGPDVPAVTPRFPWLLRPLAGLAVALPVAALGMAWHGTWESTAQAATPTPPPVVDQADDPGARGGPIAPIFDDVPAWDGGKDGALIVDGLPLDHPRSTVSTSSRATRTTAAPAPTTAPASPTVEPPAPPPPPPVIVEPPRDCTDPLVECACDHDVAVDCSGNPRTPIGLPPVVDEEEPAVDEQPPADPPADGEDPVVDIGILTPDPADEATP